MKKIINTVEKIVDEMCAGFALATPEIEWLPTYRIIKRKK